MPYSPGTGIYTLPAIYLAIPGTIILAAQHNDPLTDLETAQNYARPVIAGGTGASSAAAARIALGAAGLTDVNRFTATQEWAQGNDVASAAALNPGTSGNYFVVTGTVTITSIATFPAGTTLAFRFAASLTLTHSVSLVLSAGVNIQTQADDILEVITDGAGTWRQTNYFRRTGAFLPVSAAPANTIAGTMIYNSATGAIAVGNGAATIPFTRSGVTSAVTTLSGVAQTIGSIPTGCRKITVMLRGLSTNGTSIPVIGLGDSGGIEGTGYTGVLGRTSNAGSGVTGLISAFVGFPLSDTGNWAATYVYEGVFTLTLMDAATNLWMITGSGGSTVTSVYLITLAGSKALSAVLDRVAVLTSNGTDTFDAGTFAIYYEF